MWKKISSPPNTKNLFDLCVQQIKDHQVCV
jgi:hypothetical protein